MVNYDQLLKRLGTVMQYHNLSASVFADRIGVQRSSISHLLSGRNRPSLEFVSKVVDTFPEVNLNWLLNGKGNFPHQETVNIPQTKLELPTTPIEKEATPPIKQRITKPTPILEKTISTISTKKINTTKAITRIVIFYEDGTFEAYTGNS